MGIIIERMVLGMVSTNCYFICDEETRNTIIVDPADNTAGIIRNIELKEYKPAGILLTHGHFDHILAAKELRSKYNIKVYVSQPEKEIIEDCGKNLSMAFMGEPFSMTADEYLCDGQEAEIGGIRFKVILTPGHTVGSACYFFEEEKVLISGDTLFLESVGRTDFPTGSGAQIADSIRNKLFLLGDDVVCYPGHGDITTIEHEKTHNYCLG